MVTFLTVLHLVVCVFLIIVVLLQAGKGGGMGIAFGGAGSQTVFGSSGAGNFLTKLTSATAFLFLVTSLGLAHYSSQQDSRRLQRLAERKAEEKKVEDAKAAKLKDELDKAREGAKKTGSGDLSAPNQSEMPAGAPVPDLGKLKLTPPGLEKSDTKATPAAQTKGKVKAEGVDAAKPAAGAKPAKAGDATPEGEAPKAKKKRRVAPPADGDTSAVPAPPAEAPAAPTQ
jgi:preprotein translocase subunit SecG